MRAAGPAVRLDVRVVPRASRTVIAGVREGRLVVRVTAPPVDGAANTAVAHLLAKAFRVPRSTVGVVVGGSTRDKVVEISDLSLDEARRRLSAILA
jgi:uncharacterized protein (TIGR00251 family)